MGLGVVQSGFKRSGARVGVEKDQYLLRPCEA